MLPRARAPALAGSFGAKSPALQPEQSRSLWVTAAYCQEAAPQLLQSLYNKQKEDVYNTIWYIEFVGKDEYRHANREDHRLP